MKTYNILLLLLAFLLSPFVKSQTIDINEKIPVDSTVRIGKLDNGFTYYIKYNKRPEKRFELRLAVNAGSILEDDDQKGLAHFVEHMCFNGTKNFEKNELVKYLESMGIKFGPEINAYTSFDETVYMLTVPSDSSVLIDKSFLVMEDWAHNVSFENEEIDKERGVIIEEWRLGQGPNQRMQDKYLPVIFTGSHYAERLPIGKKEILESFDYETLKRFYKDWYRPDLMALVVVGDIDPDLAEAKIKEHFSNLKMPAEPKDRAEFGVPDHEGTLISIATDKEAPYSLIRLMYKSDTLAQETGKDYMESLKFSFVTGMLNRRLAELTEQAEPPFLGAGFYYSSLFSRSKNALQGYALVSETGMEKGLSTLLEENLRIARHGFTEGELDRYKLDLLKSMEKAYNERDKTESNGLAGEYVRNFLTNEPIPGITWEYTILKENIDNIKIEDINALATALIKEENNIVVLTGPEREDLQFPEEERIRAIASEAYQKNIEPYVDEIASSNLLTEKPKAGKIKSEKDIEEIEAKELVLSNGMKVILKPTDFKNDEILLTGFAWGGSSVYPDEDFYSASHADGIMQESGVGEFSRTDLSKILAGKSANAATSIGETTQNISGSCRAGDFETMLQLVYLRMTTPRVDEEAFQSYISKYKSYFKNLGQEPTNFFYDKYNRIKAQNHPRGNYLPDESDWDKIDFNRSTEIYIERFADASEFTVVIVGAFDIEKAKPLIEQYLGALPSIERHQNYKDLGIRPPKGMVDEKVYKGQDQKSLAILSFDTEAKYNEKDAFLISQLAKHLSRRYIEVLREEMSGVYGVGARAGMYKVPYERVNLSITIPCSPDNVDSLVFAAIHEIKDIQENGVKDEDISKAKEIYKREKETQLKENKFWLGAIKNHFMYDTELEEISSFEKMNEISSKELQRVAKKYFNLDEYIRVVLYPEAKTE